MSIMHTSLVICLERLGYLNVVELVFVKFGNAHQKVIKL